MFCFLFFYSFTWSIFNDLFLCGWTFLPLVLCAVVCSCCGGLKGVDVLEVKFINFNYVCVCVSVWTFVDRNAGAHRDQKYQSPIELQL